MENVYLFRLNLFDNYFGAERTGTQCGSPPAKRKGHVPREVDYPQHPAPIHRQQTTDTIADTPRGTMSEIDPQFNT